MGDVMTEIVDGHDSLAELEAEFESSREDVIGDYGDGGEEVWDGGGAFDVAVSISLMYPDEVAQEFLRRQFGYVPNEYHRLRG